MDAGFKNDPFPFLTGKPLPLLQFVSSETVVYPSRGCKRLGGRELCTFPIVFLEMSMNRTRIGVNTALRFVT